MRLLVRKFKLIEVICVCLGEEYEQRAINNTRLAIPTRFHRVCYFFFDHDLQCCFAYALHVSV